MPDILWVALGLAGLFIGGELLVRGAVGSAERFGVPPLVIGLTIVGFGTSAPELATSLQASLAGSSEIAIGNVVGSNIGNILLILGLAALMRPIAVQPAAFRRDGAVLLFATLFCAALLYLDALGRGAGALSVLILSGYIVVTILRERRKTSAAAGVYVAEVDIVRPVPAQLSRSIAALLAGLLIVILGARALVAGAVGIASDLGISETVIGLTIVAIGTSMPELVTSVVAVRRNQGDVAFGNIVGSNIFNILGILGLTALVQPMQAPPEIVAFDMWVMLATTLLFLAMAISGWRVSRAEGAVLLALYAGYCTLLILRAG